MSLLVIGTLVLNPSGAQAAGRSCQDLVVAVAVTPDGPADHEVAATLCSPRRATGVQVLLHGSTYDRTYWDFPYRSNMYSYVSAADRHGFATLNVDRLGYGESSHPPSTDVTWDAGAFVVHQLVAKLRGGELGNYETVVTVGHSMGTVVALQEAADYQDVDAVVATGMTHMAGPGVPGLLAALYPAAEDPKFADSGLDTGYTTTRPGTRDLFYNRITADPNVIALDEELKSTAIVTESIALQQWRATPPESNMTGRITAPVLFVMGAEDDLACDPHCRSTSALRDFEAPYFSASARFDVVTIPATGHNLNLHRTAPAWFATTQVWLRTI